MEIADATKTKDFLDKISEDPSILFTDAAGSKKTLLNVLQATFSSCKLSISGLLSNVRFLFADLKAKVSGSKRSQRSQAQGR